jgi:hypothetical protein
MAKRPAEMVELACQYGCGRTHFVDACEVDNIESITCCVCALKTTRKIDQEETEYCSAVTPEMIMAALKKKSESSPDKWTQGSLATYLKIPYYKVTYSCAPKKREEGFVPPKELVDWVLEQ